MRVGRLLTYEQIIDDGPDKGITLCAEESELGLRLMESLSPAMQKKAQLYSGLHNSAMPEGRWNPADQVRVSSTGHKSRLTYTRRDIWLAPFKTTELSLTKAS